MAEAAALGILPDDFLHMTPRELQAQFKGAELVRRRQAQLAMWSAWHTGAFARYNKKKKLPPLGPLLDKIARGGEPMSDNQLRSAILSWHKQMGGSVRVVPKGTIKGQANASGGGRPQG